MPDYKGYCGELYDAATGEHLGMATPLQLNHARVNPGFRVLIDPSGKPVPYAYREQSWVTQPLREVQVRDAPRRAIRGVAPKLKPPKPPAADLSRHQVSAQNSRPSSSAAKGDTHFDADFITRHFHAGSSQAWAVAAVAGLIAAVLLFITPNVGANNGYGYTCPSALQMATASEWIDIYPTSGGGPEPLTDELYESLANAPGVWRACKSKAVWFGSLGGLAAVVCAAAATTAMLRPRPQ